MVADVDRFEGIANGLQHRGIPVAEIEDAPVAVAVQVSLSAEGVPKVNAPAFAHYQIEAKLPVEPNLRRGDSFRESIKGRSGRFVQLTHPIEPASVTT